MLQITPGARVQQRPRSTAAYELVSPVAIDGEPIVRSVKPKDIWKCPIVATSALGANRVSVQVSDGVAGALYVIRWSPQIDFYVRVTNDAGAEPNIVVVKPIQRVVDTVIKRPANGR